MGVFLWARYPCKYLGRGRRLRVDVQTHRVHLRLSLRVQGQSCGFEILGLEFRARREFVVLAFSPLRKCFKRRFARVNSPTNPTTYPLLLLM